MVVTGGSFSRTRSNCVTQIDANYLEVKWKSQGEGGTRNTGIVKNFWHPINRIFYRELHTNHKGVMMGTIRTNLLCLHDNTGRSTWGIPLCPTVKQGSNHHQWTWDSVHHSRSEGTFQWETGKHNLFIKYPSIKLGSIYRIKSSFKPGKKNHNNKERMTLPKVHH